MSESLPKQRLAAGIVALLFLFVSSIGATILLNTPPRPAGANAPQDVFSAERAMALIEEFAQKPHPIGSVENARVTQVLVEAMEDLGYETFVQGEPILRGHALSRARNVYARLPGTDSTGAIVLCAHYDSVPYGPGAADDGSGVAAIVEAARVLKNAPPLRNDVIFLLTDGEENGLLGPRTFLEHNPWRDDLKLVVNFEARGHYGPSMMYLTWPGNVNTIRHFVEGAEHPISSSVMFDFADALPTSSDYYVFKAKGYPGFDIAFVGGLKYYHTPNDSPEKLSLRSLQHHGTYAVSLTRHFGGIDLNTLLENPDERAVYFNTIGRHMVWYSAKWIWPISLLAMFVAITALALGLARKRIGAGGMFAGALVWLLGLAALPPLAAVPIYFALHRFGPYALYNQHWFIAGYVLLTFAVFLFVYAIAARLIRPESLAAGALALLIPAVLAATIYLPMGSFTLAWPVLAASLALLLIFLLPQSEWIRFVLGIAGAAPALVLVSPFVYMLIETFTFLMGPVILLLAGTVLAFAVLPLTAVAQAPRLGFAAPAALALLAVIAFLPAVLDTRFTPDRPKMNYLLYAADHANGSAIYATRDRDIDEWTAQFFSEDDPWTDIRHFAPFDGNSFRVAEAPLAETELGVIEVVEDVIAGGQREITLFVQAAHETAQFYLWTTPDAPVRDVAANGIPWNTDPREPVARWYGQVRGRFDEGLTLRFTLDATGDPFEITLVEESYGAPEFEGVRPRPDWMIPMSNTMPVSWDFSAEKILAGDLMGILRFEASSRSMHNYARQEFVFPPPAPEPTPEPTPEPEPEEDATETPPIAEDEAGLDTEAPAPAAEETGTDAEETAGNTPAPEAATDASSI